MSNDTVVDSRPLSHTTSETNRTTLTTLPPEVRNMIYDLVLGDHTIHIKSDMIPEKSDSEDDKHGNDEDEDEDEDEDKDEDGEEDGEEDEEDDWEEDEEVEKLPAELLEVLNDDRGPLYHILCNEELLHPKDARLYRIRSLEAKGSRASRVQTDIVVKDCKSVKCPLLRDPTLEYEMIGSL